MGKMKNRKLYPISKITIENGEFSIENLQKDPKELITKEIKRLDECLRICYNNERNNKKWFDRITEARLIVRKLYTLIN